MTQFPIAGNKKRQTLLRRTVLLLFAFATNVQASITMPDIFSDHAVLQQSDKTAVWGKAAPSEKISVSIGTLPGQQTVADAQGQWRVDLDLHNSSAGPYDLSIQGTGETVVLHDVIVGDVWICSGQSNMEFQLSKTIGGADEVARSANPQLRYFISKREAVGTPSENLKGQWVIAGPSTSGAFSAVAYYFAKTVFASVHVPLGLIDTSWGGTPAEAWISSEGLDRDPDLKPRKDAIVAERPQYGDKLQAFIADYAHWASQYQREDHPGADIASFADPGASTAGWTTINLPGSLAAANLPDSGAVWLRREVTIPANRANTYLPLIVGTFHDFETVYWNGKKIGETTAESSTAANPNLSSSTNRRYDAPGTLVQAGKNTLAIRLFSPGGNAGTHRRSQPGSISLWLVHGWPKLNLNFLRCQPMRRRLIHTGRLGRRCRNTPQPTFPTAWCTRWHNSLSEVSFGIRVRLMSGGRINIARRFRS